MKISMPQEIMSYLPSTIGTNSPCLKMIIASGPYTFENNLEYEVLNDLLMSIEKEDIDVVILVSKRGMMKFIRCNFCSHITHRQVHLLILNIP
jgi:hypothetical protein